MTKSATDDNPSLLVENHPHLYHYTDINGLLGILKSQTLRATHYRFLNDPTEISHIQDELKKMLLPHFVELGKRLSRKNYKTRRNFTKAGGIYRIAKQEAATFVDNFFGGTFGREGALGETRTEPYITSFCCHNKDHPYERENGLLSQWRAYGGDGRFAIVFNTKQLLELARRENDRFVYSAWVLGSVIYEGDEEALKNELMPFVEFMVERHLELVETGNIGDMGRTFYEFVKAASRYKHRAFREEREVRLIWCPMPPNLVDLSRREDSEGLLNNKVQKEIKSRKSSKGGVPYIELFNERRNLPIETIIIGPHPDQAAQEALTCEAVGSKKITIQRSKTPYIEGVRLTV